MLFKDVWPFLARDPMYSKGKGYVAECVFHCSEPDGRRPKYGRSSIRSGQTKARSIHKYLEISSNHSVLVQFQARLEERIAISSNTITCNRSLQHTACDMYWESSMHEDEGGVIPQGTPISKVATCCTESEYAKWTTRSTRKRRKNILWPPKRIAEFQWNLVQQRWLQNTQRTHSAVEKQDTNRRDKVKKLCQQFESHPNKESFLQTWTRLKKLVNSAKSRRSWSPIWTMRRSSSFAKPLPKSNAPIVHYIGKSALSIGTCGRCLKSSQRTKELDKNNYDVLWMPGNVIKKNTIRGAKHGLSERQRMYFQGKGNVAEEEVSRGADNLCFSLQWTRWTTIKVWKKFNTIWANQGSLHTQILGNLIKTQCGGAISSSLRTEDWNFIKHDHMQLFSTTHCLRFVLTKQYAWRRRRSYATRCTYLQGCHVLYWKRIRKVDNKINKNKTQEHLVTTQAHRRVPGKSGATTLTTEYPAYPILQSKSRTRIAETKSKSWFSSSRATRTRSLSCRTWIRLKKLVNSAKSRRSWSPIWTMWRSSSFAKPHPKSNAPIVHYIGRSALSIGTCGRCRKIFAKNQGAGQEQLRRLMNARLCYQQEHHSRCQTWTFGTATNVLPRQRKYCKMLVNPSMEDINPYLRDGTKTTNTEILCHS